METSVEKPGLFIPGRTIPVPSTVSPEAQTLLSNPPAARSGAYPALEDKEAWRAFIAEGDEWMANLLAGLSDSISADIATHRIGEANVYEITPASLSTDQDGAALFYLHGGAFIYGSGMTAAHMALPLADAVGLRCFSVDYRMPPDHPFPVGLDDTVKAYEWLLQRYGADKIAVAGVSAGGGLAASFILKARDLGLPIPAACILSTPEADLTESGDTFETNDTLDVMLSHRLGAINALYANGHDLQDPYISPVFGDFKKGFCPTLLISGTRDLLLSNTVRLHRSMVRANIAADLHVWEAMPHGGFMGAPEDEESLRDQAAFIRKHLRLT